MNGVKVVGILASLLQIMLENKLMFKKLGNIKNAAMYSPEIQLLIAAREESVTKIVGLYANGAAGNEIDEEGNNLLHIAVKVCFKFLIIFFIHYLYINNVLCF